MAISETIRIGVIVEKRRIHHPWQDLEWRAVALLPGAPEIDGWKPLRRDDQVEQYHAATIPLELHRADTDAYLDNLGSPRPAVYVLLRRRADAPREFPYRVELATASTLEASFYGDAVDDLLEPVAMPPEIREWIEAFIAEHHREQPFVKRQRQRGKAEEYQFGQEPIVELRKRRAESNPEEKDGGGRG